MKSPVVCRWFGVSSALATLLLAAPLGAQAVLHTWYGAAADEGLGVAVALGDLDADGVADFALGSPADAGGHGRVTVISGASWTTLFSATGAANGELFGAAIAPAGDVNGDGHADVVVGAPGTSTMTGYARVLSGTNGAALLTLTGPSAGSRFGAAVSGAGDSNGDGRADLLIGAPQDASGRGMAGVYSGSDGSLLHATSGSSGDHLGSSVSGWSMVDNEPIDVIGCTDADNAGPGEVQIRSRTSFALLATIPGPAAGSAFGSAVARLGDTNGDGHGDLAVGAPGNGGSVRVFSGSNWSALFTLAAPASGTGFGSVVAAVGDANGDGLADLACGAPLADVNGTDSGAITLYSGNGALLYGVVGGTAGDGLGSSAACAGDRDHDGHTEFVVAAPGASNGTSAHTGEASVVALTLWNTVENGLPGLTGIPRLAGDGGVMDTEKAALSLTSARPITGATLVIGLSLILDAAHGVLVPTPDIVVTGLQTTGSGTLDYDFALSGLSTGTVIYQQFLLADSSAPGGIARSNTVAATVP